MYSLFLTILALTNNPAHPMELIHKEEIKNIASSDDCERAAHEYRIQALENPKAQVVTVCIKKG